MQFTIKQARQLSGKTQVEMANFLGIHRDTYRKIEKNADAATVEQARKIAEVTGVNIDQIFFAD